MTTDKKKAEPKADRPKSEPEPYTDPAIPLTAEQQMLNDRRELDRQEREERLAGPVVDSKAEPLS